MLLSYVINLSSSSLTHSWLGPKRQSGVTSTNGLSYAVYTYDTRKVTEILLAEYHLYT